MRIFAAAIVLAMFYMSGSYQLPDEPTYFSTVVLILIFGAVIAFAWRRMGVRR